MTETPPTGDVRDAIVGGSVTATTQAANFPAAASVCGSATNPGAPIIFGIGTGGTALSSFTTAQPADAVGPSFPLDLAAGLLAAYAAAACLLLRDKPGRAVPAGSLLARTTATLRMPATVQPAFLYAVAFSVYLPTYLANAYDLGRSDAAGPSSNSTSCPASAAVG
ncbi:hypothetical protein Snoj_17600 [Streptomyces nojiriensis]|uniref:Uncharacterized protein n=1 Tax=Streptomyces nojiriensis TaxID=66374 RepID=A0ABQ3SI71_9ACTN|nr:hypothetical protein [Streptomyces nojiriensis]QTI49462.1 putative nitrate/nitrite transporter NarK2 [Streptomyces nojiriensis]GGS35350.1 hypothetical protein GCM10010205_76850 [Streptomyces nojiriensis]GHI67842.1 hypothetical protein Snoj_17600 [Streptomyces nojiriensis]